MRVICLPLSVTQTDLASPTKRTLRRLWTSWQLQLQLPEHEQAFSEITQFILSLDRYEKTHRIKPDERLFRSHMAQAFRHAKLIVIGTAFTLFDSEATSVYARQAMTTISEHMHQAKNTMRAAVAEATKLENAGNAYVKMGQWETATGRYLCGLAALCPWSSDPTMMTFEQAGRWGLRQVEQALLVNIAAVANKIASMAWRPRKKEIWARLGQAATTALVHHPFLTWAAAVQRVTRKSILCVSDLSTDPSVQIESIKITPSAWPKPVINVVMERQRVMRLWRRQPAAEWAHRQCWDGHKCCHLRERLFDWLANRCGCLAIGSFTDRSGYIRIIHQQLCMSIEAALG